MGRLKLVFRFGFITVEPSLHRTETLIENQRTRSRIIEAPGLKTTTSLSH